MSLINVNFEGLLSDDVERFTAVHSTPQRACTLCCCAIVLDINVLALPVEAHIVTNKLNQREYPLLLWENSLESVTRKSFLNDLFKVNTKTRLAQRKLEAPRGYWSRGCIPNRWRGALWTWSSKTCKRRACSFDRSRLRAARRYLWPVPVPPTHACACASVWYQTRDACVMIKLSLTNN